MQLQKQSEVIDLKMDEEKAVSTAEDQNEEVVSPSHHQRVILNLTKSIRHGFTEPNVAVSESLHNPTDELDHLRFNMGMYREYPLAQALIRGEKER